MCDVLGPPQLICIFQRYDVYRNRGSVFVFGIDKVNQQFSCLRIPRAVQSEEPPTPLELSEGERCYPLEQMQEHRRQLPHLEEVSRCTNMSWSCLAHQIVLRHTETI
ncbi:unnamed protein product [Cladocopium goreaui]|uniref:Polyphosphoinositide phosphatase n=1 Tax=Cladocopium goreaui TaxID=2562237 RepID=A0A9P1CAN8_9DINO|nr:unnamed protein product [Cladocopium goreaui]